VPHKTVSVIICTRDRAESLKKTLHALDETTIPADVAVEVLVVDNGSRDRTRPVVRQAKCWGQSPRYIFEPQFGQSCARNTAIAAARGDVLLWTDDDVRPAGAWIEAMCRPIFDGRADAVAGRLKLPDYLERPWLKSWHRVCLAVDAPMTDDSNLVGANMAFARHVLHKVPAFDVELGPGMMGFCDDTLFSLQLRTAGFRISSGDKDSAIEHHCGEQRLTRSTLLDVLARQGRSRAYVDYHWRHRTVWLPSIHSAKSQMELGMLRFLRQLSGNRHLIIGRREARALWRWSYYQQMMIEAQRPRQYAQFGLEKRIVSYPMETVFVRRERAAA
jgi:glycosyltransferase involved in cell wall biosynthesis